MFEPFFTTKSEGMGLGLSICRSIVESHDGYISAHNLSTGGACLEIWLPAAHQENISQRQSEIGSIRADAGNKGQCN